MNEDVGNANATLTRVRITPQGTQNADYEVVTFGGTDGKTVTNQGEWNRTMNAANQDMVQLMVVDSTGNWMSNTPFSITINDAAQAPDFQVTATCQKSTSGPKCGTKSGQSFQSVEYKDPDYNPSPPKGPYQILVLRAIAGGRKSSPNAVNFTFNYGNTTHEDPEIDLEC